MKTLQLTQKIGFGKYKGTIVAELPESYKNWLRDVCGYNIEIHSQPVRFVSYVDQKLLNHIKEYILKSKLVPKAFKKMAKVIDSEDSKPAEIIEAQKFLKEELVSANIEYISRNRLRLEK